MKCTDSQVELIGWYKRYVFAISPEKATLALEEKLPVPGKLPEGIPVSENLAHWSPVMRGKMPRTFTYALKAEGPEDSYEIRIVRKTTSKPCEAVVESNLVKLDRQGNVSKVLFIYTGSVPTECGE